MPGYKYTPDMAQRFYEACCEGKALNEIATEFHVHRNAFAEWASHEDKPEFKTAYELGLQAAEAFFHREARTNFHNPKFKDSMFKFYAGVRFGWSEKVEKTIKTDDKPVSDTDLDQAIKDKIKALGLDAADVAK